MQFKCSTVTLAGVVFLISLLIICALVKCDSARYLNEEVEICQMEAMEKMVKEMDHDIRLLAILNTILEDGKVTHGENIKFCDTYMEVFRDREQAERKATIERLKKIGSEGLTPE